MVSTKTLYILNAEIVPMTVWGVASLDLRDNRGSHRHPVLFEPNFEILIYLKITWDVYGIPYYPRRSRLLMPHTVTKTTAAFKMYRALVDTITFTYARFLCPWPLD